MYVGFVCSSQLAFQTRDVLVSWDLLAFLPPKHQLVLGNVVLFRNCVLTAIAHQVMSISIRQLVDHEKLSDVHLVILDVLICYYGRTSLNRLLLSNISALPSLQGCRVSGFRGGVLNIAQFTYRKEKKPLSPF
jgi:hypothetical protein